MLSDSEEDDGPPLICGGPSSSDGPPKKSCLPSPTASPALSEVCGSEAWTPRLPVQDDSSTGTKKKARFYEDVEVVEVDDARISRYRVSLQAGEQVEAKPPSQVFLATRSHFLAAPSRTVSALASPRDGSSKNTPASAAEARLAAIVMAKGGKAHKARVETLFADEQCCGDPALRAPLAQEC